MAVTRNADGSVSGQMTPEQLKAFQSIPDAQKGAYLQSLAGPAQSPTPSMTPTQTAAPANVSSLRWNVDAPNYQDRLNHFATNQTDAQNELLALKDMYRNATDPNRQKQISDWANQVRSASGITVNDPTFGNSSVVNNGQQQQRVDAAIAQRLAPPAVPSGSGTPLNDTGFTGANPPPSLADFQSNYGNMFNQNMAQSSSWLSGQQQQTNDLMQQFKDAISALNNQNSAQWDQMKQAAADQAAQITAEKRKSFEDAIKNLTQNQQTELSSVNNNLDAAKASLQDQTFQNWLQARQQLANTGMLNSGSRNDMETRLMLAQNKQLADTYNKAQTQIGDITGRYGNKLSSVNDQIAGLNQNQTEADLFRQLYATGSKNLTDQAKMISDLVGKSLPYSNFKPGDVLNNAFDYSKLGQTAYNDYQKNQIDQAKLSDSAMKWRSQLSAQQQQFYDGLNFKYDQLSSNEKVDFAKLSQQDQQFYAQLKQNYNIDMTKVMGHDANGNPTLDAQKLVEQIRNNNMVDQFKYVNLDAQVAQWAEQNKIDATRNDLGFAQLAQKTTNDNAMIDKAKDAATTDTQRMVLDGLKSELNAVGNKMKTETTNTKKPPNADDVAKYNQILESINTLIKGGGNSSSSSFIGPPDVTNPNR